MPNSTRARHTLRAGESIRSVARRYGTTPLKLMELNPYLDPTALAAGQELNLPPASRASLWPFLMGLYHRNRAQMPP